VKTQQKVRSKRTATKKSSATAKKQMCGTLDAFNGGVDRSTEISHRRNSRYGVPFSIGTRPENSVAVPKMYLTGVHSCPIQFIQGKQAQG